MSTFKLNHDAEYNEQWSSLLCLARSTVVFKSGLNLSSVILQGNSTWSTATVSVGTNINFSKSCR